ncbi:MAG: hypothetical protein AAF664_18930 [Planctomycetota bacterium]
MLIRKDDSHRKNLSIVPAVLLTFLALPLQANERGASRDLGQKPANLEGRSKSTSTSMAKLFLSSFSRPSDSKGQGGAINKHIAVSPEPVLEEAARDTG